MDLLSGTFGTVIFIFLSALFLLWFLLPFAVFGVKGKLDQLIEQNKRLIELYEKNNFKTGCDSKTSTPKDIH